MLVSRTSRWSCPLKLIDQCSRDGRKTRVKFANCYWSVLVSFDLSIVSQIHSLSLRSVRRFYLSREFVVCKVLVDFDAC